MARRILPFRIPFFRIFYSGTYTTLYIVLICFLAITPVSMMWQSITQLALQYVVMIGATYLVVAVSAIIIYASRIYTNRTVMAALGKPYVPIEPGEIGTKIRRMIVTQLERSAIVAWESRPRDLLGEVLQAEQIGVLPPETQSVGRNDYTVGTEIPLDPESPPWGDVQHAGWSSPAQREGNNLPNVQFTPVVAELPNIIEAKAVSLAPPDPLMPSFDAMDSVPDPVVADVLRRPQTMGMREYLTQLSYLGLVNPPEVGHAFLSQYEFARFSGLPITPAQFKSLMAAFVDLMSGMTQLSPAILGQIRLQAGGELSFENEVQQALQGRSSSPPRIASSPPLSRGSNMADRVPARSSARSPPAQSPTPYAAQQNVSKESLASVVQRVPAEFDNTAVSTGRAPSVPSSSIISEESESGSVLRHPSVRDAR